MIAYLRHDQIDKTCWDDCIAHAPNGLVYAWYWYLDIVHPRWEALVLLQRDIREIFAKLDKHTRNKVRRAINSGIDVVKDESRRIKTPIN